MMTSSPLDLLVKRVRGAFEKRFGRAPRWISAAPGRVNLIGEHIDYNDGFVLPMAIDRYVVMAGDVSADEGLARVRSEDLGQEVELKLSEIMEAGTPRWYSYVQGVIALLVKRGIRVRSFDGLLGSNVPLGGGLSSSAAVEVATATFLEGMTGTTLLPKEKALLCQQAEHEFAKVPCGIMDQFSSVFGEADHVMLIDCQSQELTQIPFQSEEITVLITNSNVKHELTGGEYAARRAQCDSALVKLGLSSWREATMGDVAAKHAALDKIEYHRAKHVVSEIARTSLAAEAMARSDWATVGELMYESHRSLRDDYEVSCRELDVLVALAEEIGPAGGVLGARMTGGGFGGCTVSLVRAERVEEIAAEVRRRYREETSIDPMIFASRPARGAHLLLS